MTIIVEKGDITRVVCDAIVNPANSYGFMGGGVAGTIKKIGGNIIENEAINQAPIELGSAVSTTSGNLPCKHVIHAPTMKEPAMRIKVENVKIATTAAFKKAIDLKIKTIAFPGMGTGVGGVPIDEAAEAMIVIAKKYQKDFDKIIFIGFNEKIFDAFKKYA